MVPSVPMPGVVILYFCVSRWIGHSHRRYLRQSCSSLYTEALAVNLAHSRYLNDKWIKKNDKAKPVSSLSFGRKAKEPGSPSSLHCCWKSSGFLGNSWIIVRGNLRTTEKQGRIQPKLVEPPCWVKSCLGEGQTKLVKTKNLLSQCGHGGHRKT